MPTSITVIDSLSHDEIMARHEWLIREVLETDPQIVSPHTRKKLDYTESLARAAHALADLPALLNGSENSDGLLDLLEMWDAPREDRLAMSEKIRALFARPR